MTDEQCVAIMAIGWYRDAPLKEENLKTKEETDKEMQRVMDLAIDEAWKVLNRVQERNMR
jgi:hypothetical protein